VLATKEEFRGWIMRDGEMFREFIGLMVVEL
jgi:hypothetical protein